MAPRAKGRTTEGISHNESDRKAAIVRAAEPSESDLRLLRLFNHYRHDWMNDIQILMGYVQLKKYDKLTDLMEKIKEKVRQESCVSKLGIPSLIVYLLAFQAEVKELELKIRMEEEIRLLDYRHAEAAEHWIVELLESFKTEAMASTGEQQVIELHFEKRPDGINVAADYHGTFNPERIKKVEDAIRNRWFEPYGIGFDTVYGPNHAIWTVRL